jgi:pimeloyl-ACP methyl ester carboxylesterase
MPTVQSRDGTRIGFDRRGEGPVIIFVAGATQYRAVDTTTPVMADALANRFTIVTYDRRGRGESGDTAPYAVAREIEDIAALIEASGGKAGLFGMSSGAILALEAAAVLPDQVSGVLLYEPPVDPQQSSAESWRQHAAMAALAARGDAGGMMVKFMSEVGMPPDALEGFRRSPAWPAFEAVGLTLEHDYRIMAEATDGDAPPARWQGITVPVLVVNGDASYPFIAPGAEWVAAAVPGARRRILAGQGHDFDPKILGPVLADFLAGAAGSGSTAA